MDRGIVQETAGVHRLGAVLAVALSAVSTITAGASARQSHGRFVAVGPMAQAREEHTATLLPNGKVLITGGCARIREELVTSELYDPAQRKFIAGASMHEPRCMAAATLLRNGKVLVSGGYVQGDALATAELYDPAKDAFTYTGRMDTPRFRHTATLLTSGKVLIAGGFREESRGTIANAELYDPGTGKFSTIASLQSSRGRASATTLKTGEVLIVGGLGNNIATFFSEISMLTSVELYQPGGNKFTALSRGTYEPCAMGEATLLADGKVLTTGGYSGHVLCDNARLFDPTRRMFDRTGSMKSARIWHTSTRLRSGQVLVAGGRVYAGVPLASTELFDPSRGVFVPGPDMTASRKFHTATLLPGGEVLIAGGQITNAVSTNSAEIYLPEPATDANADARRTLAEAGGY